MRRGRETNDDFQMMPDRQIGGKKDCVIGG